MTADEKVAMYSDLIRHSRKRIEEERERIAEYAYKLEQAARESANAEKV